LTTQFGRFLFIETTLPPDTLLLEAFEYTEQVSQPFLLRCTVLAEDATADVESLLWTNVCIRMELSDGDYRPIQGLIRAVHMTGHSGSYVCYELEVVPRLWFLSLNSDCRVFHKENMAASATVPEIVKEVLKRYPRLETEWNLVGSYPEREFCVQYRESDLHFVSRLLEDEGIYYFFRHTEQGHCVVFSDSPAAVKPCATHPILFDSSPSSGSQDERVIALRKRTRVHAQSVALSDYNFLTPGHDLLVTAGPNRQPEQFDYPGKYPDSQGGERYARLRVEEADAQQELVTGTSNCRTFQSGFHFSLERHTLQNVNRAYMLTKVQHRAVNNAYRSGGGEAITEDPNGTSYENSWEAIPKITPYRPVRVSQRPQIGGTQTAVVVGDQPMDHPDTDRHGRVKIHFFWDRYSRKDGKDSCWVRVSQPWAGRNWGTVSIPRIGQEVIVEFLEGDPDRPIVTGRVYNEDMKPPYELPAGAVNMGFRSRSIGGGGYNELSVNDTNTSEGITIHAQKDMSTVVENNETIEVKNCRTEKVGVDETITIGNNRTETVGVNETITIGSNRQTSIGAHEVLTVGSTRTQSVGINEMINVGAAQQVNIGALQLITVGLAQFVNVGVKQSTHAGSEISIDAPKIVLSGTELIELKCGGGSITIDAGGNIVIKGTLVKINC